MSQNKIWWYNYRKESRRLHLKMSVETIVRKAFGATLKEYVENGSIGGIKQMCDTKASRKERVVYAVFLCAMFCATLHSLIYTWVESLQKPPIVTMESDTYPISQIDFPAVALCNINRISKKALNTAAKTSQLYLSLNNESRLPEVEWFFLQSGRLIDYTYDPALRNHDFLLKVPTLVKETWDVIEGMKNLGPKCEDMLVKCAWGGHVVNCSSIFTVRRTVYGHCCAFNYVLGYESAGNPNETIASIKRQSVPGVTSGLAVVLDPMVDDYAYPFYHMVGIEVLIFDPTHFADPTGGRVIQRNVQPDQSVTFELHSTKQVATKEVRKYPFSTRQCLFHDEGPKDFNKMYSYSACIVNCRIKTVQSLCKCTPFYLPTNRHRPICTVNDLRCLNKHKEKLLYLFPRGATNYEGLETELQNSLNCPNCLPDCELTHHSTKHSKVSINDRTWSHKNFRGHFLKNLNMSKKSVLCIYQATTDGVLNRLDVVSYWFEIISNVGGMCGVLVGISIIPLLEFIYYVIIRFPTRALQIYHDDK